MPLTFLRNLTDCSPQPWKNGGGTTRELWVHPAGSSLAEGFQIRLSVADVGSSGPFSTFPDIDRTLLLLEGGEVELEFEGRGKVKLPAPFLPVSFAGEWTTQAHLGAGPCRDFNVMTDRRRWRHQARVLKSGDALRPGPWSLIYAAVGPLKCGGIPLPTHSLWEARPTEDWPLLGPPGAAALQISLFEV